ncbi:unnamed protein product, partial [Discosporangium mesarthrocarpum]
MDHDPAYGTLLRRRPDVPLCNLRRIRLGTKPKPAFGYLRGGEGGGDHKVGYPMQLRRDLASKQWANVEQEVQHLLKKPTTLPNETVSAEDRAVLGKAIVDHPGRDDPWVVRGTAGITLCAATPQLPVEGAKPVSLRRLQKAHKRAAASCTGRSSWKDLQREGAMAEGLATARDLVSLQQQYRLGVVEGRLEAGSIFASPLWGKRRPKRGRPKTLGGHASPPFVQPNPAARTSPMRASLLPEEAQKQANEG